MANDADGMAAFEPSQDADGMADDADGIQWATYGGYTTWAVFKTSGPQGSLGVPWAPKSL